jgi:hypothetical protein
MSGRLSRSGPAVSVFIFLIRVICASAASMLAKVGSAFLDVLDKSSPWIGGAVQLKRAK